MGNGRLAFVFSLATSAVAMVAACGGSSDADVSAPSSSDGGTGDGSADGSAEAYTLDNVCERTGPVLCNLRKSCCEKSFGYDEAGCLAHAKAECEKDVADARAGKATFYPDRIDSCIAKFKPLFDTCTLTFDVLLRDLPTVAGCQIFEGQLTEGQACERGSQCKAATAPDTFSGCDDDTKKCNVTTFLGEGATCQLGDGTKAFCKDGLYCDVDFQTLSGTCKKKTALGQPCDGDKKPTSLECGLGSYCDPATKLCTPGKGGGAACTDGFECAVVDCKSDPDAGADAGKTCKAPGVLVKTEECKGP